MLKTAFRGGEREEEKRGKWESKTKGVPLTATDHCPGRVTRFAAKHWEGRHY